MSERTIQDLQMKQALPLNVKIRLTQSRIRQWVNEFGEDGVYVSFSGGKDSTVLLHIVREMYPQVPGVFVDTGLEYPEIRDFVRTFDNIVWLKPKMNFRAVIEKYGYPFISKEISKKVYECRKTERNGKQSYARRQFEGTYVSKNGKTNFNSVVKWAFLLDSPFEFSHMCCNVMKKNIVHAYEKQTGKTPFTGQLANESKLRLGSWIKYGCNAFEAKKQVSNPMAFWTEQDVLLHIKQNHLPICSVYGDIVEDGELEGQMSLYEYDQKSISAPKLKTTGCNRTGCMFCAYGCHLSEKPGRFERMKETHPKQYEWIMKPWDEGGLGYKEVIDWLNEHGDLHIRY